MEKKQATENSVCEMSNLHLELHCSMDWRRPRCRSANQDGTGEWPGARAPRRALGEKLGAPTSNRPSLAQAMQTILAVFWRLVGLVPGDLGHLKCPRPWKNNCLATNRGAWPAGTFRACHQPRSVKLSPASGRVVIGFPRPANGITPPNELRGCNH